ncbi:hypothetical protein ACFSTH_03665 [Paenibacillus yanchengensis]|uniref:Cyclic lactone autoinducer peptide n=1 Tax=Paenibacillus yanchengensis TaxID=2035833 RepID=A0ABW4YG24_9BACL
MLSGLSGDEAITLIKEMIDISIIVARFCKSAVKPDDWKDDIAQDYMKPDK